MTRMLQHYVIPDAQVGVSKMRILALRCANCEFDFHIDKEPQHCPRCGTKVSCILPFGVGKMEVPAK